MEIHESVIVGCRIQSLLWQSGNYVCFIVILPALRLTSPGMYHDG